MIRRVFETRGFVVQEKHGGISEPAAALIDDTAAIVYVYGTQPVDIRDTWDRSLVIRELDFAAHRRPPAVAVIIGDDGAALQPEAKRLRKHLKRQLRDKVCLTPTCPTAPATTPMSIMP